MIDQKKPLVQSVERALDILETIFAQNSAMRSSDIACKLGLNANTANNLIRTLYRRGYLTQDENGRYLLGGKCARLGEASDRWSLLREAALDSLKNLSVETGDGVTLGVNDGGKLHCVLVLMATGAVQVLEKQLWLERLHTTAGGKVLLAGMAPYELDDWLKRAKLVTLTPRTLSDPKKLRAEVELTRQRGWATCIDEAVDGLAAIGVPVTDSQGRVVAAVAQSFPTFYPTSGKIVIAERVKIQQRYAQEIAAKYEIRL
jgi:DNA-binding IclR family transcriptional regulator